MLGFKQQEMQAVTHMIIELPMIWFIILFVWSYFILKRKKNKVIVSTLIIALLLEVYSVIAMNKAIDVIDFSLKDGFGFHFWFYSSLVSFFFGLVVFVYLSYKYLRKISKTEL
jgi:hypothetical protein